MKFKILLFGLTISAFNVLAQKHDISVDTVWASTDFTTILVFPDEVGSYDIGSDGFGAEKINSKSIKVKAALASSAPTNILVSYGEKIYHATLAYKAKPAQLYIDFSQIAAKDIPQVPNENRTKKSQDSLRNLEHDIAEKRLNNVLSAPKATYKTIVNSNESIYLSLFGMESDNDNLYLKLLFLNKSKLQYAIDFIEFAYREPLEEGSTKGGYDTKNVYPVVTNKIDLIYQKDERYLGYAIPRFALSKKGELLIIVREKNGSRSLKLTIPYSTILECKSINKKV